MDSRLVDIVDYYTSRYSERDRLDHRPQGRIERIRTLELLAGLLPEPPARVLDVGGGPGAYARPLTEAGFRVRLVDLVPEHVNQARQGTPPVEAVVGDARALGEPDDTYDATLLLGPLYHLLDQADRVQALREAARVTRPGGVVAAAAISRFAGAIDFVTLGRWSDVVHTEVVRMIGDGAQDGTLGFTHAYFHRPDELLGECSAAGLESVVLHGVEGPSWQSAELSEDAFDGALELARLYSTEPHLIGASAHLLAVGRVPA
jgi:SAM-dependent methyltransferase